MILQLWCVLGMVRVGIQELSEGIYDLANLYLNTFKTKEVVVDHTHNQYQ